MARERTVLFVCVANAGRSLIAEAIFNATPPEGWRATSAGTQPAERANPRTARLLAEIGLAVPDHPPQLATSAMIETASERITMGCLDSASCPARLKSLKMADWALPDPERQDDDGARRIRDEIQRRVELLKLELVRRAHEPAQPSEPPS